MKESNSICIVKAQNIHRTLVGKAYVVSTECHEPNCGEGEKAELSAYRSMRRNKGCWEMQWRKTRDKNFGAL